MPGRVSVRNSAASRISHKSSSQTLASRRSTASPAIVLPEEGPTSVLRNRICNIFSDAQKTTAGHRKLVVGLRKIQETSCYESRCLDKRASEDFDEDDFDVEIARCVIRVMGIKRSEVVGDRIIRFIGFFLRHSSEKGSS